MKKIFITGIFLMLLTSLHAQKLWSYRDCIAYAISNNLQVQDQVYEVEKQKLSYRSTLGSLLPSVSAGSSYNLSTGRSVDPNTNSVVEKQFFANSISASSSVLLFNGFRKQNEVIYEKYELLASEEQLEKRQNDIAYQVLDAYIMCLIDSGLTNIQDEQVEVSRQEVRRMEKRIELGLSSGSELYEAKARLASDEYQLIQYKNLSNKAKNDLKKLMNFPVDSALILQDIEEEDELMWESSGDTLFDVAKNNLPEIKSLHAQLKAAKKLVGTARASLTPTLSASASWGSGYYETNVNDQGEIIPFTDQLSKNKRLSYGVSLSIPIFDGFRRRISVQQAKINHEQAKNDLNIMMQTMEYEVNQAIDDWEGAMAEYTSSQQQEESMAMAFKIADKKWDKGIISIMDYYEAKNNYSGAKAELLRTRLQLFLRARTLNFFLTGSLTD